MVTFGVDVRSSGNLSPYPVVKKACYFFQDDLWIRVQQVAETVFAKISDSIAVAKQWDDSSVKTFAIIGCAALVILLIITIFKRSTRSNDVIPNSPPRGRTVIDDETGSSVDEV